MFIYYHSENFVRTYQYKILFKFSDTKVEEKEPTKCKFGFPTSQANAYTVSDCRGLVKTLVCGVKTITWRFKVTYI